MKTVNLIVCLFLAVSISFGQNTLTMPTEILPENTIGSVQVDLTNADVISAGQLEFDYNSTQGVIIDGAIAIGQASSHIISFNEDTSNPVSVHVTIMFYSMSGETISAGSGNIIDLTYTSTAGAGTPLTITELMLSDADAQHLSATGIDGNLLFGSLPPVAVDDNATTQVNTSVDIDILANDTDDGTLSPWSVNFVTNPSSGSVTTNTTNGVVTYEPNQDYTGSDSFTYTVDDDDGNTSNTATVNINVNPPPGDVVDIAIISNGGCSDFEVKMTPHLNVETLTTSTFTVCYPSDLELINFSSDYGFQTVGSPVISDNSLSYYQIINLPSFANVNWTAEIEYTVLTFEHDQSGTGNGDFEIINNDWTTANNGDYYVEQFGDPLVITGNITANAIGINTEACFVEVSAVVLLYGAYDEDLTSLMRSDLTDILPLSQPYSDSDLPFNYTGNEQVDNMPDNIVDWVLVELRSDETTVVETRAALLNNNGILIDADDLTASVKFYNIEYGNDYYIVIRHRNHIPIMSSAPVTLPNTSVYDFTTAITQAYGEKPMIATADGFAMPSGDLNYNNEIKISGLGNDRGRVISRIFDVFGDDATLVSVVPGYFTEDANMDGIIKYTGPNNDPSIISYNLLSLITPPVLITSVYTGEPLLDLPNKNTFTAEPTFDIYIVENQGMYEIRLLCTETVTNPAMDNLQFSLLTSEKIIDYYSEYNGISSQNFVSAQNNKYYQTFATIKWNELPETINAGDEFTVLSFPKNEKVEIVTEELNFNGDFYVSLWGQDKTGNVMSPTNVPPNGAGEVIIYPNPSNGNISVNLPGNTNNVILNIFDILSNKVYSENIYNSKTNIDLGQLSPGTYIVKIETDRDVWQRKIIIK